ncbi:MAG: hypothetical protein SGI74_11740 [Oligoflexia bacterium]|nr:hypothetical protein [Oligoflexia bacterium]
MQSALSQPVTTANTSSSQVKRTEHTYEYRIQNLGDIASIASSVTVLQPDYSSYIVRDRQGNERRLSEIGKKRTQEYQGMAHLTLATSSHSANLRVTSSLSDSPFKMQKIDLSFEEGFFNKSTLLGVEYSYQQQVQPLSYFIDRDLATKARAVTINTSSIALYYEQIISKKMKNLVKTTSTQRLGERPRNFGIEDRLGYALTRHIYLQGMAGYISEDEQSALHDERGYFNLAKGELAVTYEPIYDLLLSVSYGLLIESEYEPRTDTKTKVGTDQYGLGFQYSYGDWRFQLTGAYYVAQIANGGSVLGGITWTF